ncbi:elongation of fatty acids protein 3-like [Cajanus cajan]|uniref:very-long-chain 3-oxoacyl-CoA synthase n=1 Tax=Cajanus cajan TaxID=3821 RepID=A0A151T7W9_CAJCA|nr:elongation of fatty acids protein 3-like [Cajanus cajan]KYP63158.1 Elongation of fatty acids protein 3 [Cajanus cajan]
MSLEWWVVKQGSILNFTWNPPETRGSSPLFLALSILTYLSLTLLLSILPLPAIPPRLLKPIAALHNLILLLLSLLMALGCALTLLTHTPHLRWALCIPPNTKPTGPLFFWAYIFYLSKFLEFLDTLLILLSRSMKRLSFLHVYHHATVPLMCYLWLHSSQSLFPIALLTNASVHVIMYAYYFLCALGIPPSWKRAVTHCQILQFLFSFAVSALMLHHHFFGPGCSGISAWCFNALFNASLLALFLHFHLNSYATTTNKHKHS